EAIRPPARRQPRNGTPTVRPNRSTGDIPWRHRPSHRLLLLDGGTSSQTRSPLAPPVDALVRRASQGSVLPRSQILAQMFSNHTLKRAKSSMSPPETPLYG